MIVVTVFRPGLSVDAVATARRRGLGSRYRVSERADRVVPAGPEAILVARNRILRADVCLVHQPDRCALQIRAGGPFWNRPISEAVHLFGTNANTQRASPA